MSLSNLPPKGTADWFPEEFAIRKYIFDTWRAVNLKFGYQEYLTPILENSEIYKAKSGADIGGKELLVITDRAGRELSIRPEMTPSVTRMITRRWGELPKPIRLFSIANFWRNEQPQRGRNREFWQLNTDIFGSNSLWADIEILQISLELMLAFKPPAKSFTLYLNHRGLIDAIIEPIVGAVTELSRQEIVRTLDKFEKLPLAEFKKQLSQFNLTNESIETLIHFLESKTADQLITHFPQLKSHPSYQTLTDILKTLTELGYADWVNFNPSIIRGFDYYDGMVFEVFDNHPDNNRAMFGGGRYNGLAKLFGNLDIPAVGFAPGDETTKLFLESWNLIPTNIQSSATAYLPLLDEKIRLNHLALAHKIRSHNISLETNFEVQTISSALSYANKRQFPYVIILGPDEISQNLITLKNMQTGEQVTVTQSELITKLKT